MWANKIATHHSYTFYSDLMTDAQIKKYTSEHLKICSYKEWDLFLHPNQYPYIGRSYAWAKRADAESLLHLNKAERDELFEIIIPAWNNAIAKLFQHDLSNFAIFANTARHLHAHLIPRYNAPRSFEGMEFVDPNPAGNYAPYPKKEIPADMFEKIRTSIKNSIC